MWQYELQNVDAQIVPKVLGKRVAFPGTEK